MNPERRSVAQYFWIPGNANIEEDYELFTEYEKPYKYFIRLSRIPKVLSHRRRNRLLDRLSSYNAN